jgi:hypothetical protein
MGRASVFQILSMVLKIAFASLICGVVLSAFDLTAVELLEKTGLTPQRLLDIVQKGLAWALPNIVLGSLVIVPIWCLAYMLRPPRG